jgi:hypothetical protein
MASGESQPTVMALRRLLLLNDQGENCQTVVAPQAKYGTVRLFNHEWNNSLALKHIGTISAGEIKNLSGGLLAGITS